MVTDAWHPSCHRPFQEICELTKVWLEVQLCNPTCHMAAHFSTPTVHWPVFSRSLECQMAMLSGLHKSGTPEVLAQAAPDTWECGWIACGFQHPTQIECYFRLCFGIWALVHSAASTCAQVNVCLSWACCHGDGVLGLQGLQCSLESDHVESAPGSIWTFHRASLWLVNNIYYKKFSSELIHPV